MAEGKEEQGKIDFHHPYTPYDIQETFMNTVYEVIEKGGVGILESPTGTGKSLSLICGSLTWLRDFQAKRFSESLVCDPADEDEPEWIVEQAKARKKREMLRMREDMEERLRKVREREKKLKEKFAKGERGGKKRRIDESEGRKGEIDENEFLLEEWESDDEGGNGNRKGGGDGIFSAETLRLMEKVGMKSTVKEEEIEEEDGIKIYYCSRTHSQLTQFINELRRVKFPPALPPEENSTSQSHEEVKHLTLGSRKNLCVNPLVNRLPSLSAINERCSELQKSSTPSSQKCPFLPKPETQSLVHDFRDSSLATIQDIEDSFSLGKRLSICPYYASRSAIRSAEIVTLPYPLLLQKSAREALGIKLEGNVVIVDEAHNLMDAIAGIHGVEISLAQLKSGREQLGGYLRKFGRKLKGGNRVYVAQTVRVVDSLVGYLEGLLTIPQTDGMVSEKDLLTGKGVDQINLFKLLKYLSESKLARKVEGYALHAVTSSHEPNSTNTSTSLPPPKPESTTPVLHHISSLLSALTHPTASGHFFFSKSLSPLSAPTILLKYQLLDPSLSFQSIVSSARAVLLSGGTMSPFSDYSTHLFPYLPASSLTTLSCGHVIPSSSLYTTILSTGPNNINLDFSFRNREDKTMIAELGLSLLNICNVVPDGVVVFFPSYAFLASCLSIWDTAPVPPQTKTLLQRLAQKKPLFQESKDRSADDTLKEYSQAIDLGKGGLLFSVVGGKMSEGINFSDALGRCVVIIGLPFPNARTAEWKAKLSYIEKEMVERLGNTQVTGEEGRMTEKVSKEEASKRGKKEAQEFYTNTCMRAVNQSIGRAIRHKGDYAAIVLVDGRYKGEGIREKLPAWIKSGMGEGEGSAGADAWGFRGLMAGLGAFFRGKRGVVMR